MCYVLCAMCYVLCACAMCRFSDAGNDDLTVRSVRPAPKSAKARNRVGRWCRRRRRGRYAGFGHGVSEGRAICDGTPARSRAQLKRYGTNVAKWGFHVLSHL